MTYSITNSRKSLRYDPPPVRVRRDTRAQASGVGDGDYEMWLREHFPAHVVHPFAPRHRGLWEWFVALTPRVKPLAKIDLWGRGGAKSSTAELGVTFAGTSKRRTFVLYISDTQTQSDKHLQAISGLLEHLKIGRAVNVYNQSKGWTQRILRAANGFNAVSLGLDASVNGIKLDQWRPDLIIFDDVDNRHDSLGVVQKKIATITDNILPTGSSDCAVLFIQNLLHKNSVAAQLVDGRAAFLLNRMPIVVEPAVRNLEYEQRARDDGSPYYVITGGEPTWAGQSLATCQGQINEWGLTAFLEQAQHEVDDPDGGMYGHLIWRRCKWSEVPPLARACVWCDPAVTNTDQSDCHGVQADGIAADGTIYRLYTWEQRTTPQDVLCRALLKALELGAQVVGVETDQGGDTWESVYQEAWRALTEERDDTADTSPERALIRQHRAAYRQLNEAHRERQRQAGLPKSDLNRPAFRSAKAGSGQGGKVERGAKMLADYERGRFVHVEGTHLVLERALKRFPKTKPFDAHDAAFWSWHYLTGGGMTNSAVGAFG